jgi:hypothetical protein
MPALLVVPGSKCAGPDHRDCFVISSYSLSSPGRAKTVHPRVAGQRFGVGPLARCERLESASCDLSSNIKSAVRRRFATPERSRREQLRRYFPMAAAYEIIEHS